MDFEDLSPELKEKALACKTTEELVELAEKEGIELTEDQLDSISGGSWITCDDQECNEHCGRLNWNPYC